MIDYNGNSKLTKLPILLREAQDSVEDLEALLEVSKTLHSIFNINDLFSLIVKQAIGLTDADRGCLLTVSPDQNYQIEVAFDRAGQPVPAANFRTSHTVIQEVISTRQPLNRDNILAEDEELSRQQSVSELGLRRVLCAPMVISSDQVVGLIYVDSVDLSQHSLSQRRLRTLSALAGHAAIALYQAQLYNQVNQLYQFTKILDEAKSEFICIASHELRTPLTLINGYTEILGTIPEVNDDMRPLINGISSGIFRLTETVNEMLYAAQIDQGKLVLDCHPYPMKAMAKQVLQKWQDALEDRQLSLKVEFNIEEEDRLIWTVDPTYLQLALDHLLQNGIKNTPDGGEVILRLSRSEGTLKIEVVDTGIGIKPEHRDLVFMKFYRTTNSRLHSSGKTKFMGAGPGLGLYLVRGIIEAHGGSVRIEDNHNGVPKPGTKFVIQLPELGQRQETVVLESSGRIITCNRPVLLPTFHENGDENGKHG